MGIEAALRVGVAVAKKVIPTVTVLHTPDMPRDVFGDPDGAIATVARQAVVEDFTAMLETEAGRVPEFRHRILFLENVAVGFNDTLVLPDGTTGPIRDISGPRDPLTGRYVTQVVLGSAERTTF